MSRIVSVVTIVAVAFLAIVTLAPLAKSATVEDMCRADYINLCSDFEPYTAAGDSCMRSAYDQKTLSGGCRTALYNRERGKVRARIKGRVFRTLRSYGIYIRGH